METTASLCKALAAAQLRAQAVEKDATNTFHRYRYASAEAIIAEARQALSAEGLSVFPVSVDRDPDARDHVWQGEGEEAWISAPRRIRVTYRLMHESGESMDFTSTTPVIPEKGRPEDKAEFGARTENLGYTLRDLLLLPRVNEEAAPAPSARDDRSAPPPRAPAGTKPVTERPWMKRLQSAIAKLKLGEARADADGLKGKEREDKIRGARLLYLGWVTGRDDIKSTLDLTDAEAAEVIKRAEAGETP